MQVERSFIHEFLPYEDAAATSFVSNCCLGDRSHFVASKASSEYASTERFESEAGDTFGYAGVLLFTAHA
jgi:hypothetical protein